jgi:hypothetical protein
MRDALDGKKTAGAGTPLPELLEGDLGSLEGASSLPEERAASTAPEV